MLIGSKRMIKRISDPYPNIFIESKQVKQVYECKTLGVTVDQHLSWKSNTQQFLPKICEFLLFIDSSLILTKKHLFLYIMLLFASTSTIAWDVFGETPS